MVLLSNPSNAQPPAIHLEQVLRVGSDYNYPPYELNDAQGMPTGFNIDLIRAAAEAVGLRTEVELGVWNEVRDKLASNQIDVIAGMYYSRMREKSVDFSVPHNMVSSALFVRDTSPIKTFEQARERCIIVQKGDISHDYLVEQGFTTHIVAVDGPLEALQLLASGKHDGVLLSSKIQGLYFLSKNRIRGVRAVETHLPVVYSDDCGPPSG
jgi:ABC-type amino acid transport substrate-binding protein